MFHFEETVGVLSLLPNMALVKLPCMAIKVYMFCFLQQSVLLLVSVLWDVILNGVKTYKIISHVQTARKYKNWLADSERSDMTLSAKTVREKLLKKHFFFQESPKTGKLEDPGLTLGLLWYMFGEISVGEMYLCQPWKVQMFFIRGANFPRLCSKDKWIQNQLLKHCFFFFIHGDAKACKKLICTLEIYLSNPIQIKC